MMNSELPRIGIDLDGVLVRPVLLRNIGLGRRTDTPPLPSEAALAALHANPRTGSAVRKFLEHLRYSTRLPMPGIRDALAALAQHRRVNVVSARSHLVLPLLERWLHTHGLRQYIEGVHLCDIELSPPQFKLHTLQRLGISAHIEDDGTTAHYLATNGLTVYLCDWPGNRGLTYPPNVRPVANVARVPALLLES